MRTSIPTNSLVKTFVVLIALCVAGQAVADETDLGAPLPTGSRKVAEHRFRSSSDFEGTLKFYKTACPQPQFPRKSVVNQPGVKAVHIPNPTGRGGWEGLNIYESNDEVRIYVIPNAKRSKKKDKDKEKE